MKCSDLQFNLTLYADGFLGESESMSIKQHLEICPLCRQKYDDYREIRAGLRLLQRHEVSNVLRNRIKFSVRSEIRTQSQSLLPVSSNIREWLQMRVMPFGVGVFASLLIGVTFLTTMFSGILQPPAVAIATNSRDSTLMLANSNPFRAETSSVISPADYAQSRLGFANESPSINPKGALIALTKSFVRGGMKDDEVVVVADVFSNGLARISEVVEPSRDRQAVIELEKALQSDAKFAPFVPSVLENRPDNIRVVLKFQSVDVSTKAVRVKRPS